jgi:Immunity protein Imm1
MIIYFCNYQDKCDPDQGRLIPNANELGDLLDRKRQASPFIAEFCGAGDFELTVGLGGDYGCVQRNLIDGTPPYLMALSRRPPMKRGCIEFLCGGTPTPVAARYILRFHELKEVVLDFALTGGMSDAVFWRELEPKACLEDVERPLES